MKNITPNYCSFEQCKWLKEKGFSQLVNCYYFDDGEFRQYVIKDTHGYYGDEYTVELEELYNNWNDNYLRKKNGDSCFGCPKQHEYFETFSAPEQWQVIYWLLYNHGIWIQCQVGKDESIFWFNFYIYKLELNYNYSDIGYSESGLNSPQAAYSAAFDFIRENNLI